jgi:hypothetical protein
LALAISIFSRETSKGASLPVSPVVPRELTGLARSCEPSRRGRDTPLSWRGGLSRIIGSTRVDNPNGRPRELLGNRNEGNLVLLEQLHEAGEVELGAAETVHLLDQHTVDLAGGNGFEEALQRRPLEVAAGKPPSS